MQQPKFLMVMIILFLSLSLSSCGGAEDKSKVQIDENLRKAFEYKPQPEIEYHYF